jgi:hypothetical protein
MRIVAEAMARPDADDRSNATISLAVPVTSPRDATDAPRQSPEGVVSGE